MEAIVLAGGLGTRLRGVVDDVPKPMAPVDGRPFLALILDRLVGAGFNTAILAVGYRYEAIQGHFGNAYRGLGLCYSVETEPLGTGGAIRLACEQASARDIFVLNGDTYVELDFRAMLAAHVSAATELSMAIHHVADVARYGALDLEGDIVRGFREKGRARPGWINAGAYVMSQALRARFRDRKAFSFESDLLAPEMESIQPRAFRATGLFIDIGVPEDYARARQLFSGHAP
jgi:D-glycero-alpha-D-manno-heptose 1-phosphate guanylyltransferase